MPKSKAPKKKYTPKPVRVPVTDFKFDQLSQDLHFSLMAFEHGGVTVEGWKRIAKVLMTVSFATDGDQRIDRADKIAIDSAVLTVKALSDFEVRTGKWHAGDLDLISLKRGVVAADKVIRILDFRRLQRGYIMFRSVVNSVIK